VCRAGEGFALVLMGKGDGRGVRAGVRRGECEDSGRVLTAAAAADGAAAANCCCCCLEQVRGSIAIEWDVSSSSREGDPGGNHVSVHSVGKEGNSAQHTRASLAHTSSLPFLADGRTHRVRVRYERYV
jgi:hypothetical protein